MLGQRLITLVRRQSASLREKGLLRSVTAGFAPAGLRLPVRLLGYAFSVARGFCCYLTFIYRRDWRLFLLRHFFL